MYYFKSAVGDSRCRAAICILGVRRLVRVCFKTILFDGVLSADVLPLLKSHGILMSFWRNFRIHWHVDCETSLGPLCLMYHMKCGRIGPHSISEIVSETCTVTFQPRCSTFRLSLGETHIKTKGNMELRSRWKRTGFHIQILADATALDGPSTWEMPVDVPESRQLCSWRRFWQSRGKEAPWDFLSGNLPWLQRHHQGHQNINTFFTLCFQTLNLGALW